MRALQRKEKVFSIHIISGDIYPFRKQLKVRMDSKFRVFSNGSSAQKRHVQMMHTRQGRGVRGRRLAMHAPVGSFWGRGCTAAKDDARPIRCMRSKETLTLHTRASTQAAQDIYITIFRC
jgi:hypothetical protein